MQICKKHTWLAVLKMKFVLLLLAFAAVCYSYPYGSGYGYGSRNININEDGTILITGSNGKRIQITKGSGSSGQRTVDISVSGPNIPTKRIQINEQNELSVSRQGELNDVSDEYLRDKRSSKDFKKQRTQGDILTQIFSKYQGDIDQVTYQQLLREVSVAVQAGQLSPSIYEVLQSLGPVQGQWYWGRQQGIIGGQRQGYVLDLLREQAIEQELQQLQQEQLLQQQGVRIPVYVTGQQSQYPYSQRYQLAQNEGRITGTVQDVLDVPSGVTQRQIVERPYLSGLQGVSYIRGTGIRGLGVSGQQGIDSTPYRTGRTLWGVRDLLSGYGQNQWGQVRPIGQPITEQLSEVIDEEREILDEQRQIQQRQLQQQELLQQQILQQQQLQQQQRQQQLLQQVQQQQLPQQEQLWQQQYPQQYQQQLPTWRDYLLNSGRSYIQQQGLWQQQPGVYSQGGLYGGYGQNIPLTQRYNVPLVL